MADAFPDIPQRKTSSPVFDAALQSIAYLLFVGMILTMGWREPLGDRFISQGKTSDRSNASALSAGQPTAPKRELLRSSLDYGPYRVKDGVVEFINTYDPKALGNPFNTKERYPAPAGATGDKPLNKAETLRD